MGTIRLVSTPLSAYERRPMSSWNFADLWEVCAGVRGEAPAAVHGDRTISWAEFDRRADGVAAALLDARPGAPGQGGAVPLQRPRVHARACTAASRPAMVPVNTNYRYADDELVYLWDNADAAAVDVPRRLRPSHRADPRPRLPKVKLWLWVEDGTRPRPDWACDLRRRRAAAPATGRCAARGDAAATTGGSSTRAARPACPRA